MDADTDLPFFARLARWLNTDDIQAYVICLSQDEFDTFVSNNQHHVPQAKRLDEVFDYRNKNPIQVIKDATVPLTQRGKLSLISSRPYGAWAAITSTAQVGRVAAHVAVLKKAKEANPDGWTLAFEWDARPVKGFDEAVKEFFATKLPTHANIGMINLGCNCQFKKPDDSLFRVTKNFYSTHALLWKNSNAGKMLDAMQPFTMPIDNELSVVAARNDVPEIWAPKNNLFSYTPHVSTSTRTVKQGNQVSNETKPNAGFVLVVVFLLAVIVTFMALIIWRLLQGKARQTIYAASAAT